MFDCETGKEGTWSVGRVLNTMLILAIMFLEQSNEADLHAPIVRMLTAEFRHGVG